MSFGKVHAELDWCCRTSPAVISQAAANATDNNVHCMPGQLGSRVCFFPCARYNYWEECFTSFNTPLAFTDPSSFVLHNVKVMQFVVSCLRLSWRHSSASYAAL